MNVLGQPRQGAPLESKPYISIVFANIPHPSDRGIPPNPTKPWLEMSYIDIDVRVRIIQLTLAEKAQIQDCR